MLKRHLALAGILILLPAFLAFALPIISYRIVFLVSLIAILAFFITALVTYVKRQWAEKKSLFIQEDFLNSIVPGIVLGWVGCFILLQVCQFYFQ